MRLRGVVDAKLDAVVQIRVRGPNGSELEVGAIIDTGFAGSLTLPDTVAVALGLLKRNRGSARLGDGTLRQFDLYSAEVDWDGWQPVLASAIGRDPLIGMRLLAGHALRIDVKPGGAVEIAPLS